MKRRTAKALDEETVGEDEEMFPSASAEIVTRVAIGGSGGESAEAFSDAFLDGDSQRHDTPLWRQLEGLRRSKNTDAHSADSARLPRQTAARHLGRTSLSDWAGGESEVYELLQDPHFFPSLWPRGDIGRERIVSHSNLKVILQ